MWLDNIVSAISRILHVCAGVILFAIGVMIVMDVIGRDVFNAPLVGTFEIVSNAIVVIAFLQLNHSLRLDGMLKAGVLLVRLPTQLQHAIKAIANLLGAILFALIIIAAWEPMLRAWEIREYFGGGSFRFPTYPVRSLILIMAGLAVLNYALLSFRDLSKLVSRSAVSEAKSPQDQR